MGSNPSSWQWKGKSLPRDCPGSPPNTCRQWSLPGARTSEKKTRRDLPFVPEAAVSSQHGGRACASVTRGPWGPPGAVITGKGWASVHAGELDARWTGKPGAEMGVESP